MRTPSVRRPWRPRPDDDGCDPFGRASRTALRPAPVTDRFGLRRDVVRTPGTPAPPDAARRVFGDRLELAARFAAWLAGEGVLRGLIGPREVPRLWERHLLNCAVVGELVPSDARVVDVGSGAGLPGLALACRRADLRLDLVESLARRVAFLHDVVTDLGLDGQVRIVHGRAEDAMVRDVVGRAEWATARAVAPLDRLVRWCLPLLQPGGTLLAMKGEQAASEVEAHAAAIRRAGGVGVSITECGRDALEVPVRVVVIRRGRLGQQKG